MFLSPLDMGTVIKAEDYMKIIEMDDLDRIDNDNGCLLVLSVTATVIWMLYKAYLPVHGKIKEAAREIL